MGRHKEIVIASPAEAGAWRSHKVRVLVVWDCRVTTFAMTRWSKVDTTYEDTPRRLLAMTW